MSINVCPALLGFSVPIVLATVLGIAIVGMIIFKLVRRSAGG